MSLHHRGTVTLRAEHVRGGWRVRAMADRPHGQIEAIEDIWHSIPSRARVAYARLGDRLHMDTSAYPFPGPATVEIDVRTGYELFAGFDATYVDVRWVDPQGGRCTSGHAIPWTADEWGDDELAEVHRQICAELGATEEVGE